MTKVYDNGLERCRDLKLRVWGENSIPLVVCPTLGLNYVKLKSLNL